MKKHLAIDIGASSGRHIVGYLQNGKIVTEEVYRFPNAPQQKGGHLIWDVVTLFSQIQQGIATAIKKYGHIDTLAIDTWAVDYVLMRDDREVFPCYAYRDARTENAIASVHALLPFAQLYQKTGIQYQPFNSIYQFYSDQLAGRLETATDFLMLPEYFLYKLTGIKVCEYTNATSTGLLNAATHTFDREIISALNLPAKLFEKPILQPGRVIGGLTKEVQAAVGENIEVVLCATHDTASAVLAAPIQQDDASPYISSGTWSLLGIEQPTAHLDAESMRNNFTNEGGLEYTFRYQKNISGLWMLQSVRRELNMDYATAEQLARANPCSAYVDCNDPIFLAPKSMCAAVRSRAGNLTNGALLRCIYQSLAEGYRQALAELQQTLGVRFQSLHIIGGGSQDTFLNALTAEMTNMDVIAGPSEATALGNLLIQMMASGEIQSHAAGRRGIEQSFSPKIFQKRENFQYESRCAKL